LSKFNNRRLCRKKPDALSDRLESSLVWTKTCYAWPQDGIRRLS